MKIHLVDGTYELFRSHFGAPSRKAPDGREVGATLGLLNSLLVLLTKSGATHVACAFDHVIESFRNELFPGYKTSAGVAPELLAQFALAEQAVAALGVVVWPMVEFEADDALASATLRFSGEAGVEQVVICSRTKTSPRWFWATRWSAGIVAATSCMTKRLCWRNLGFDPPRFPIGWPWSAIPLTATRGSPAGGKVCEHGALALRAPRVHSRRLEPMGPWKCPSTPACREYQGSSGGCAAVSPPGHAATRRSAPRADSGRRVARCAPAPEAALRRVGQRDA